MTNLKFTNIFDAVTDDKELASEYQTRADLMSVIRDIIASKGWEQKVAAKEIGLTQPRVSDLANGRIDKFSIDKLMTCLFRVGYRFKPQFKNNKLTMAVESVNAA
jgi:predicted XRE-type DNA-binding protein